MSSIEQLAPGQLAEPESAPERLSLTDAGPVLDVLSSETARATVVALRDGPATTSTLAGRVDTSLQNVWYHLSKLEDVGLVTVAGTRYSEKGREMDVYALSVTSLVIREPTVEGGATRNASRRFCVH